MFRQIIKTSRPLQSINRLAATKSVLQTPRTKTSAIVASCNDYKFECLSARTNFENRGMLTTNSMRNFSAGLSHVKLPDLGEGTKEATVKEWFIKVGDRVEEYDDLVEVFTDKLVAKIPSTHTGIVKEIKFAVDDVCLVGHSLLSIETEGGEEVVVEIPKEVEKPAQTAQPAQPAQAVSNAAATNVVSGPDQPKALSTPAVRHMAKKHNLDINTIPATGKGGRVTKEDVINFMDGKTQPIGSAPQAAAASAVTQSVGVQQPPLTGITDQDKVKKITGMKKAMTKTMTQALTIPTFTYSDDMDATKLIALRKELKKTHKDLTMLPFFIKALSLAMEEYPLMNSVVDPEIDSEGYIKQYVIKHDHNFAVAIDSPDGLTTPLIKNCNQKSIMQINKDLRALVDKAASGGLTKDDFEGGTFSVSSVGNIGGKYFVPTILRPQASIIAIGKAVKAPKFVEGSEQDWKWEPIDQISFSITADHRIIDGATCARFSQLMKSYIENPNLMLLTM